MNQTTKKTKSTMGNLLLSILFSFMLLIGLFFLLSNLIFKAPDFDEIDVYFPILLLTLEGISIVLFCRRFSARSVFFTLISSIFISLISFIIGLFVFGFAINFPKVFATHGIFIFATTVMQLLIVKKKPTKRKKLPFKK